MKDSEDERGRGGEREDWKAEGERERQSDRERRDIWNDSKGEGARQWERKRKRERGGNKMWSAEIGTTSSRK